MKNVNNPEGIPQHNLLRVVLNSFSYIFNAHLKKKYKAINKIIFTIL